MFSGRRRSARSLRDKRKAIAPVQASSAPFSEIVCSVGCWRLRVGTPSYAYSAPATGSVPCPRLRPFSPPGPSPTNAPVFVFRLSLLTALLLLGTAGASVAAQSSAPEHPSSAHTDSSDAPPSSSPFRHLARRQFSAWVGHSVYTGTILGKLPDGTLTLVGLRYHRLLIPKHDPPTPSAVTLTYTADLVPVAAVSFPVGSPFRDYSTERASVKEVGFSSFGAGVSPMGLRLGAPLTPRLRPFLAGQVGLLYFWAPLPDERGRRLNFTAGLGVGLQVRVTPYTTLTVGYRYHHLSNGFRGTINPGFDANLLYIGLGLAP